MRSHLFLFTFDANMSLFGGEHVGGVDSTKSSSKEWHRKHKRGRVAALLLFPSLASTLEYVFQMSQKKRQQP